MLDVHRIQAADFAPLLHQTFRLTADEHVWDVELTEVSERKRRRPDQQRLPFALLFKAAPDARLPQRMYRIEHATLGAMDLLLVPVGADQDGRYYEAIFG
jgi:hypothetical protein